MKKILAESLTEYREINKLNEAKTLRATKVDQTKKDKYKESIKSLEKQLKDVKKPGSSVSLAHKKAKIKDLEDKIAKFKEKLNEAIVYGYIDELDGLNEGLFNKKEASSEEKKPKYVEFIYSKFGEALQKNPKLKPFLEKQEESYLVDVIKQYKSILGDQSSGMRPKFMVKGGKLLVGKVGTSKAQTGSNA